MKQITKNVYVEPDILACNLGLITTNAGNVLIDSPLDPVDAVRWRQEAEKKGDVKYLINTEEHPDHFQTSDFLPGTLITSAATRAALTKESAETIIPRLHGNAESIALMKDHGVRLAEITFTEQMSFYLGELSFELIALPGHSPGGIGVYIPEEKLVFTTDIIFNQAKSWLHVSVPEQWLASLKKIEALDVDYIVPGHGEICTKAYLKEQARVVEGWVAVAKTAIAKGLTAEQACQELDCPDPHPKQAGTPMDDDGLNQAIMARLYALYA
jgi:cyclase